MHFEPLFFLFASLLLARAAPPEARVIGNPTVTVSSGVVVGTATGVANQPTVTGVVHAFLGVPFAMSPTGSLRFAPPSRPSAWSKPLLAQKLPSSCLQQFSSGQIGAVERTYFNNPSYPPPSENEDCLYLNVFTSESASPSSLKPVMFWLFGGNLQFGTASLAFYNGSSLAVNEDVVVVVPNYRTNIFGFSNSPQIAFGQQNSGFLDQRLALQWVQENIKAFGGDPTKVTLFGESAGGYSVKQLLANPPSPPSFRAAIMESQATFLDANGAQSYTQTLDHFNCANDPSPIACLRKVPATTLEAYVTSQNLLFPPVVGDGTYVRSNSLPSIQSGKFAKVPILIGTNRDEARAILTVFSDADNKTNIVQLISNYTGVNISGIQSSLLQNYSSSIVDAPAFLITQILTDIQFTCPTQSLAAAIANASQQPVWRYRYDAQFPNTSPFPNAGAYHTSEIPEVWGTYPLPNVTQDQIALSRYMQSVWTNFAKDPAAGPSWPKLGSNGGMELGILGGAQNVTGEVTVSTLVADFPCLFYDPLLYAQGDSY